MTYHDPTKLPIISPSTQVTGENSKVVKTVYTPTTCTPLNSIFDNIVSQIEQLGTGDNWKLELTVNYDHSRSVSESHRGNPANSLLLSSPNQRQSGDRMQVSPSSPLSSSHQPSKDSGVLAISSRTQYPWDFIVPLSSETWSQPFTDEIQQQIKDARDRQRYLQDIIQKQADQINQSRHLNNDAELAIATMRSIFLMMENEQKLRYTAEIKLQQKEIEMLERKSKRLARILETIESIQPASDEPSMKNDGILLERQQLLRKLHLAELRLSARDAEMDYIIQQHSSIESTKHHSHIGSRGLASPDINKTVRRSPTPQFSRKGPPYLFQQQYSPKMRSSVRPSPTHRHHQILSGLDSLGMLADQMLSNPDFEHNKPSPTAIASSPLKHSTTLPRSHQHEEDQHPNQQTLHHQHQHQSPSSNTAQKANTTSLSSDLLSPSPLVLLSSPQHSTNGHIELKPTSLADGPYIKLHDRMDDPLLTRQKRSKRSIDSATALLSIPMLSSSFQSITESPEQHHETSCKRSKLYNFATWTPDEDEQLRKATLFYGSLSDWDKIANTISGRSSQQCQQRWVQIQSTPAPPTVDARQSPSIAALLDTNNRPPLPVASTSSSSSSSSESPSTYQH